MNYETQFARWIFGLGPKPAPPTGPEAVVVPVDVRKVPESDWLKFEGCIVLFPPDVSHYIAGMTEPMTALERDSIEDRVCAYHGIANGWTVVLEKVGEWYCFLQRE